MFYHFHKSGHRFMLEKTVLYMEVASSDRVQLEFARMFTGYAIQQKVIQLRIFRETIQDSLVLL